MSPAHNNSKLDFIFKLILYLDQGYTVVLIDECGFSSTLCRNYGYTRKGRIKFRNNARIKKLKNTSLIAAITENQIIYCLFHEGGTN